MDQAIVAGRSANFAALGAETYDVVIVGGGINGATSAAALAAKGARVALVERGDFASATSQESSNLVWGGFKYLENYEIPLVFKLCRSRNRLMKSYPTSMAEIDFLATLDKTSPFPSWLASLGTFGYWGLGMFATRRPRYLRPKKLEKTEPIINTTTADAAIQYGDAYLKDNDARFVWQFVRSAIDDGATVANYVEATDATWDPDHGGLWSVDLVDQVGGKSLTLKARAVVNAAGPFVDAFNAKIDLETNSRIVYSKGIHLIVPQLTSGDRILAFFDDTQRLFYVIPMAHRSVIGTTDTRTDDPNEGVTPEDRSFLLKQINERLDLDHPLTEADIISERCGVRPLVVANDGDDQEGIDWTSLSRKHAIEVDKPRRVVSIFGGKLTDCLNIGEEVIEELSSLGIKLDVESDNWFGEPSADERQRFLTRAATFGLDRPAAVEQSDSIAHVLWRRHGVTAHDVLDLIADDPQLGDEALRDSDVLRAELPIIAARERIVYPEDFLRRRTKLSLIHRVSDLEADPGYAATMSALGLQTTLA